MTCAPLEATKSISSATGAKNSCSVSSRLPELAAKRTPRSRRRRMRSNVSGGTCESSSSSVPSMSEATSRITDALRSSAASHAQSLIPTQLRDAAPRQTSPNNVLVLVPFSVSLPRIPGCDRSQNLAPKSWPAADDPLTDAPQALRHPDILPRAIALPAHQVQLARVEVHVSSSPASGRRVPGARPRVSTFHWMRCAGSPAGVSSMTVRSKRESLTR